MHPLETLKKYEQAERHREQALDAAKSLPNQSVGELLQNAEKIEKWLNQPIEVNAEEYKRYFMKTGPAFGEQKTPAGSEGSDGVSGD